MSLLSLPDIAGMLVLMGVLGIFRRRHRDERVDGWLLGLTFILVEMVAASISFPSGWLPVLMHVVALDAYLLAAVMFGWTARRDLLPGTSYLANFLLPAIPLAGLTTIFGLGIASPQPYLLVSCASLVLGLLYLMFWARLQGRLQSLLVIIHIAMWLPMLYLSVTGRSREVIYWGLACLYLLVALSFRRRVQPQCIGAWVVTISFVIWSMCFLAVPIAHSHVALEGMIEQIWNIQKFFVIIGMLLMLLEEETRRRRDEAMHDGLTGLPNRRLFKDRLDHALERSRRSGTSAAVFAIDLNGFKEVNDTFGHQAGDAVLKLVAENLKRRIRGADTVARCGGDEFSVVVNDLSRPEHCARIAETLRDAIQEARLPGVAHGQLGGSIGWAVFPQDALDADTLNQLADMRMYSEKKFGPRVEMKV